MKLFFAGVVIALGASASFADVPNAEDTKFNRCLFAGGVFASSAMYRDHRFAPEEALRSISRDFPNGKYGITEAFVKRVINLIYFDPSYAYAGGDALSAQVRDSCLRDGKPEFQPLK